MPSPTLASHSSCTPSPQRQLRRNGGVGATVPYYSDQHVWYHHHSFCSRKTEVSLSANTSMHMSCDDHVYHHSNRGLYNQPVYNHNGGQAASNMGLHRGTRCFLHRSNGRAFALFTGGSLRGLKRRRSYIISQVSSNGSIEALKEKEHVAILWFKKDLRLDDHPGLCLSAAYHALLPVYIFDPHLLRGWSNDMLEALVEAVADLKLGLQGLGSDLIIRRGSTKVELCAIVKEINASVIITEKEIEHEWREIICSVMPASTTGSSNFFVETWDAPLYDGDEKPSSTSYKEFQKMRRQIRLPEQAPTSMPAAPDVLEKGCVPPVSVIKEDVRAMLENNVWHKNWKDIQTSGAETFLSPRRDKRDGAEVLGTEGGVLEGLKNWRERYILAKPFEALNKKREELPKKGNGVGATNSMGILEAYLRFLEPTWRKDWKIVYEAVAEAESIGPKGASFRMLLGNSLTLGTLSRRRIYNEAFEYEKARNGGWSPPFGFSTFTAAAAIQEVKSAEWYQMLAAASELDSQVRIWRWRGFLIQYIAKGENGSPIVLVHGFGAFGEHYRDNIENLAEDGNRVWALTLLGFGKSEKPDVAYTELLWAELIRDFIVEVVGEPAVVVGNSIGGYMVSMVAGLWPEIVKSLILLNTAGGIVPDFLSHTYEKPSRRNGITWAGSHLSLAYLRRAASQLLKRYYPVNPSRADEWLMGEILRASHDPGAAIVLESFYCLKNPFPINWFLDRYKGKVLVIQGTKDPLSNSTQRKKLFELYCTNAVVQFVDAGHCPHDEIPGEVNKLILDWLKESNSPQADSAPLSQAVQHV